jgi:hypothetical protein
MKAIQVCIRDLVHGCEGGDEVVEEDVGLLQWGRE